MNVLIAINLGVLGLVHFKVFTLKSLVAIADGFFLANALIGLATAIILFKNGALRYIAMMLTLVFFGILCFSNPLVLTAIVILFGYTCVQSRKSAQKM